MSDYQLDSIFGAAFVFGSYFVDGADRWAMLATSIMWFIASFFIQMHR